MLPQAHIATRCGPFKAQAFSSPRAHPARERCQTAMTNVGPFMPLPDFTAFIRATKEIREAERRQTRAVPPARIRRAGRATEGAACAAPSPSGALACRGG